MLITNCAFLENELMDVVRLFKNRPEQIVHSFRFEDGVFYNQYTVDGDTYAYEDKGYVCDELHYKRLGRRYAKLRLYALLSERYGEKMPWGALTGIRPTKLAYMEQDEGRNYLQLFQEMQVEPKNIRLVQDILKAQQGLYEKTDDGTDYFVSLPFCPTKCAYCSFITAPITATKHFLPSYLDALDKETENAKQLVKNLRSVYIGGGTPFALDLPHLERVLSATEKIRTNGCEYTVEAGRPDVFDEDKLRFLKAYGVTRICINPQTFSNETLEKIGRKHTVEDFYNAYEMSRKYGFIVNIDLIAGLADESVSSFANGVERAVETGADNITVHCLCLKSGAKLKEELSYIENDFIS